MDHDDGDASQGAGDGGADAGSDAGPGWDSSTEAACMEVGGDYVVTGTCPGLPQAGTVEQTGCALAFSQALGAVIGETGTIEGQVVTTVHCSGLAMTSDGVRIDLTCQANQASCEAALRSPETSTF